MASVLTASGVFDNSAGNPANPDPSQRVRVGFRTVDEMFFCLVYFTRAR